MPVGEDLHRVKALTTSPTFVDYYLERGGPYNPEVGEIGYMYASEAVTAEVAGDVLIHSENTPQTLETLTPRAGTVTAFTPGNGAATHIAQFQPCVYDDDYTITVTMAIDGGLDVTAITAAGVTGATAEIAAADLANQVAAGVVLALGTDGLNVYFTPSSGELTKFEIAVTPTVAVAVSTTRFAPSIPENV